MSRISRKKYISRMKFKDQVETYFLYDVLLVCNFTLIQPGLEGCIDDSITEKNKPKSVSFHHLL